MKRAKGTIANKMCSTLCLLGLLNMDMRDCHYQLAQLKLYIEQKKIEIYRQRTQRTCLSLQGRISLTLVARNRIFKILCSLFLKLLGKQL